MTRDKDPQQLWVLAQNIFLSKSISTLGLELSTQLKLFYCHSGKKQNKNGTPQRARQNRHPKEVMTAVSPAVSPLRLL